MGNSYFHRVKIIPGGSGLPLWLHKKIRLCNAWMCTVCLSRKLTPELFLPTPRQTLSEESVWRWYSNIPLELEFSFLDQCEKDYLAAYYRSAGLLKGWRRPFFRHHYVRTFAEAAAFLLSKQATPRIIDLGGGSGTQCLLLALMGARIFVMDVDCMALRILRKRQAFYQDEIARQLDITVICTNTFHFNYKAIAPIDGVYSLFAFNMMQPTRELLELICPYMDAGSCFVVQDGNPLSWVSKVFPSRRRNVLSPVELESELDNLGFTKVSHRGGVIFPPALWALLPASILRKWDEALGQNWLMPVSHQIVAIKR